MDIVAKVDFTGIPRDVDHLPRVVGGGTVLEGRSERRHEREFDSRVGRRALEEGLGK